MDQHMKRVLIEMATREFIADLHNHYLAIDNDCNYCKQLSDEEIADLAAVRATQLVRDIRTIEKL